ncbi:MAG: hypothetical protein RL687_478 [Candidatus Parcubacteria bacterium]|jgi:hypothetical protein
MNKDFYIFKLSLCFFVLLSMIVPHFVSSVTVINSSSLSISARVNSGNGEVDNNSGGSGSSSGGGGGGGGGGSSGVSIQTTVNISGIAYPLSKVSVLQDGKLVATTISDPVAKFSLSITGLSTDTYTFSVFGEDPKNLRSVSFSFPVFVTAGTTVNIGNIFLSPTVNVDKSQVKQGDNLEIFGHSAPEAQITISVHSPVERFYNVKSSKAGLYLYNLDTTPLELGKHETKSKAILENQPSSFSAPVEFLVSNINKEKDDTCFSLKKGDISCDNRINLTDFSIMAFWYKKSNPPSKVDLNNDKNVTLVDFSILAYYWTG